MLHAAAVPHHRAGPQQVLRVPEAASLAIAGLRPAGRVSACRVAWQLMESQLSSLLGLR